MKITVLKEKIRNASYMHYSSLQFCLCLEKRRHIELYTEKRRTLYNINLEAAKANITINKCLAFFTFWMSVLQSRQKVLMVYINISLLWRSLCYSEKMPWRQIYQKHIFLTNICCPTIYDCIFQKFVYGLFI